MKTLRHVLTLTSLSILLLLGYDTGKGQTDNENPWGGSIPSRTDSLAYERYPVEGFAWPTSVKPNETIKFYISIMDLVPLIPDSGQGYEMKIFRSPDFGTGQEVYSFPKDRGRFYPLHDSDGVPILPGDTTGRRPVDYNTGCIARWDSASIVSFSIPEWQSGLYFARLKHTMLSADSDYYYMPFIIRASTPGASSKILFKFDWNTLQAYNYWGGGSLYSVSQDPVTLARDSIIALDRPIRRDYAQWTSYVAAFEKVLRDSGYSMEYCNNMDIDRDTTLALLSSYNALVLWMHDEYWSGKERNHIETFKGSPPLPNLPSGLHGNIARFSANTCYWRIHWVGDGDQYLKLQCRKHTYSGHPYDLWRDTTHGWDNPEAKLLGSQYETGWNDINSDPRTEQPPDRVHNPSHWIFRTTDLDSLQEFGQGVIQKGRQRGLVSGEVDNTIHQGVTYTLNFPLDTLAQRKVYSYINGVFDSVLHQMIYYEDTESNARVFGQGAFGGGWTYSIVLEDSTIDPDDVIRMKTITINIISHFSGKKYIGKVYTGSDFPLEWDSSVELDGDVEIPANKYLKAQSSTITVDSTFAINGTLEINGNVTIAGPGQVIVGATGVIKVMDGATLTIAPTGQMYANADAQFSMGSGSSITVNGVFHAEGTANNRVKFISTQGALAWNGINAYNPNLVTLANLLLNHVEISGASRAVHVRTSMSATISNSSITGTTEMAIEIVPNLVNSGNSNEDVLIENVTITPDDGDGIVVVNTSLARIQDCILSGSAQEFTAGLRFANASPVIVGTKVENFYYGVLAVTTSTPAFQDGQFGGYNTIRNNIIGVQCEYSNAVLGIADPETEWEGGMNSIYDNETYNVVLIESEVYAQNNWWGDDRGPDLDKFSIDGASKLYYEPWLDYNPNGGSAPLKAGGKVLVSLKGTESAASLAEENSPEPMTQRIGNRQMREAIAKRLRGKYQEAIGQLRSIIESASESLYVKRWAVSELLSNTGRYRSSGNSNYLRNLRNEQLQTEIRATLPPTFVEEHNATQASTEWDQNINGSNNTLKRSGLYGKFVLALYKDENMSNAVALYNRLQSEYQNSPQTNLAERQLQLARALQANSSVGDGTSKIVAGNQPVFVTQKPTEFALKQNYPNPFNPSTTIKYELPENSHVSLKLYDILGSEALTLVDENKQAGYYEAKLRDTRLASGVYFYRLQAGRFVETKKLVLLR